MSASHSFSKLKVIECLVCVTSSGKAILSLYLIQSFNKPVRLCTWGNWNILRLNNPSKVNQLEGMQLVSDFGSVQFPGQFLSAQTPEVLSLLLMLIPGDCLSFVSGPLLVPINLYDACNVNLIVKTLLFLLSSLIALLLLTFCWLSSGKCRNNCQSHRQKQLRSVLVLAYRRMLFPFSLTLPGLLYAIALCLPLFLTSAYN